MYASVETKIQWAFKKISLKNDDFFKKSFIYTCVFEQIWAPNKADWTTLNVCMCVHILTFACVWILCNKFTYFFYF